MDTYPQSYPNTKFRSPPAGTTSLDYPICTACGTQFEAWNLTSCHICDDPRQYVPPTGQTFTTLRLLRSAPCKASDFYRYNSEPCSQKFPIQLQAEKTKEDRDNDYCEPDWRETWHPPYKVWQPAIPLVDEPVKYKNVFEPFKHDANIATIHTEPKFGIGQRAFLLWTPAGTVMWDCIAFLDEETIERIKKEWGRLASIVISHPHYYTTCIEWAEAFGCDICMAGEDLGWMARFNAAWDGSQRAIQEEKWEVKVQGVGEDGKGDGKMGKTGVTVMKLGGHFPGSLVAEFRGWLLIADTIVTVPGGKGDWGTQVDGTSGKSRERPKGMPSYSFMWSIPNMIPLNPDDLLVLWRRLKEGVEGKKIKGSLGAFSGMDIVDEGVVGRVLESLKIQCMAMGWTGHEMMKETWEG